MSLDVLPTELLQIIFTFVRWHDLKKISLVCRQWAEAAEPILVARSCLAISHRAFSKSFGTKYAPAVYSDDNDEKQLIEILSKSNRNYTHIRVDWEETITGQDMETVQTILKICRAKFSPQKLHLKAFSCATLTGVFDKPCNWLEHLTELHFQQRRTTHRQPALNTTIEISLPKLKQLTWLEENPIVPEPTSGLLEMPRIRTLNEFRHIATPEHLRSNTAGSFQSATLDVPALERLKVKIGMQNDTFVTDLERDQAQPNDCCLFLPNLQLKSCSKLQHVHIEKLCQLDQRFLIRSKGFWQNLKSLQFFECAANLTEMICEKCSNLQELSIHNTYGSITFENLSTLSSSLKKLTLVHVPLWFSNREVLFSELQGLSLVHLNDERCQDSISVKLIAPKLTEIFIARLDYNLKIKSDTSETGTMIVDLDPLRHADAIPLPNITEIELRPRLMFGKRDGLVQNYLNHCPNLKRLTVYGRFAGDRGLDLNLQNFSDLEYLCGDWLVLRLADFHQLMHLKLLELKKCTITANPADDGEVMLTVLKNIRLETVEVADVAHRTWDHFPIKGSGGLQPSMVKAISGNVFSTT